MRWWKSILLFLCLVVAISVFFAVKTLWHDPHFFPVRTVFVEGVPEAKQQAIQSLVEANLNRGLLSISLPELRHKIEQASWVAEVKLQRVWPQTLKVIILPEKPVAIWNGKYILNSNLKLTPLGFSRIDIRQELPKLYAPEGNEAKALFFYQKMSEILMPLNVSITKLVLAQNHDLTLLLSSGLKIEFGQQHILTRLKRFVKVYPTVFSKRTNVMDDVVDLRYSNGMAIRWGTK